MQFTTTIVAAIMATSALAAPTRGSSGDSATNSTTSSPPVSSSSAAATPVDPLLTQKLFLADLAADRYALLPNNKDFLFDFNKPRGNVGKGGDVFAANRKTFPALVGSGSGMAVGFLGPCGFNTPHLHPRATELQIVTEGKLITEMVPENGVFNGKDKSTGRRVIRNEVGPYQMTPFYQGSVHAQFNPDCKPATFVASFNSEDFGAGQIADELFSMDDEVVAAAFGQAIDGKDVDAFKKRIPESIALGVEQCLIKCKINKN
ncbi:RmlC-like cupin domain-containing protein [Bisporella sp. PMI_857]|nr:RmlC-like cupin domain-containing protein [Bisporella sp. PMI_857]